MTRDMSESGERLRERQIIVELATRWGCTLEEARDRADYLRSQMRDGAS